MSARETYVWDRYHQQVVRKEDYHPPEIAHERPAFLCKPVERGHWVYDRQTGQLVSTEEYRGRRGGAAGPQIISDIEPYKAVAADVGSADAPVISGRRQHREFLRRNGYVEVGNEPLRNRRQEMPSLVPDIKRAMGE